MIILMSSRAEKHVEIKINFVKPLKIALSTFYWLFKVINLLKFPGPVLAEEIA